METFDAQLIAPLTVEELVDVRKSVQGELAQLNREHQNLPFSDEARQRFGYLTELNEKFGARIKEQKAREDYIRSLSQDETRIERQVVEVERATRVRVDDIYRIDDLPFGEAGVAKLTDRAKAVIERAQFPHTERDAAQTQTMRLLADDDERGSIAWRVVTTGGPLYNRAFWKKLAQAPLTNEEARALSLAGSGGGFAVPFDLDPTVIPTSNGAVNPLRQISRVIRGTVDTWRGVASAGITSAYAAEATVTTDNAPTLVQPEISTEKAQSFVPMSIEISMDWAGIRAELGRMLQDSKDELEAVEFVTGSGSDRPFGVLTGTTNTVNATGGADVYDIDNLYALMNALPPRYWPNARFVGSLVIANRTRRFQTSTDMSNIWADSLVQGTPSRLLGQPFHLASAMPTAATTGLKFLLYGDFSRYVIYDRVGLSVELIPHLFQQATAGTGVGMPTGQRGIYAFWRNGAKVVDANGFRALLGTA